MEYVVRSGTIADAVAHVYVDAAVYFAQHPDDVHACTDGAPLLDNNYDPTPTPLPTPAGQCKRMDVPRFDVAALDGPRSLGQFTANGTYSGGHTLVVHDVTVVLENGTTVSDVYDTVFRAVTERTTSSGTYGIELSVTDYTGSEGSLPWRFGVDSAHFDPTSDRLTGCRLPSLGAGTGSDASSTSGPIDRFDTRDGTSALNSFIRRELTD